MLFSYLPTLLIMGHHPVPIDVLFPLVGWSIEGGVYPLEQQVNDDADGSSQSPAQTYFFQEDIIACTPKWVMKWVMKCMIWAKPLFSETSIWTTGLRNGLCCNFFLQDKWCQLGDEQLGASWWSENQQQTIFLWWSMENEAFNRKFWGVFYQRCEG